MHFAFGLVCFGWVLPKRMRLRNTQLHGNGIKSSKVRNLNTHPQDKTHCIVIVLQCEAWWYAWWCLNKSRIPLFSKRKEQSWPRYRQKSGGAWMGAGLMWIWYGVRMVGEIEAECEWNTENWSILRTHIAPMMLSLICVNMFLSNGLVRISACCDVVDIHNIFIFVFLMWSCTKSARPLMETSIEAERSQE